jgi:ABC-type Na+ efflux pump permease subunit
MTHEHRDTVVVENDRSGSSMGAILGIIAIIVLLVAVWYVALGPGASSGSTTNNNNTVNGGNAPAATQKAPAPTDAPAAS